MEEQLYQTLNRIRQIDRIIEEPIQGMIEKMWDRRAERLRMPIKFDRWFAEQGEPQTGLARTTSCLCMATLQQVWQARRRFAWMKDDERLKELRSCIQSRFDPASSEADERFENLVETLSSKTFGPLNALTAGLVFRVLLQQGEGDTHGELGFLAFFAMTWSLERRYPDKLARGASLGPWGPTAYVTARCLLPIASVSRVCRLRADHLQTLAKLTKRLPDPSQKLDQYDRWQFAGICEQVSKTLFSFEPLSIAPDRVREAARRIAGIGGEISPWDAWDQEQAEQRWSQVLSELEGVLCEIGEQSAKSAAGVEEVFEKIDSWILTPLKGAPGSWEGSAEMPGVWKKLAEGVQKEWRHWGEDQEYLDDLREAGRRALQTSRDALSELKKVSAVARRLEPLTPVERIARAFNSMAGSYLATRKVIDQTVQDDARWCRGVMERQIAHMSAGNYTEFDAAELVSAIAVAVRWGQINTPLQVRDAVSKALAGAREDGSWSPSRPFYLRDDAVGAWPLTSDLVSTLANAIRRHPDVDVADAALMRYVDWLERTRLRITRGDLTMTGWASDRSPSHERIDLWATSFAIDALLEIRDLLEYRLWQLCEKRFTVIAKVTPLSDIDPVDLGAEHKDRLHRRLYRMARKTQGEEFAKGQYSFVLHGPPGSSKTKVAEAISGEMWTSSRRWGRREPRLVRVTPADFTRGGEDRIDFEACLIFDLLRHLRGVTIFFDEIDDLLRKRDPGRHPSFIDLVIPGMLNRLQDLRDACPRQEICFLIATNYIEKIEPALIRKGRIDEAIPVTYPDAESRRMMVCRHARALEKAGSGGSTPEALSRSFREEGLRFAEGAGGWPWTALDSLLRNVRTKILEPCQENSDLGKIFENEGDKLRNTFSEPGYRSRYKDVLIHPNLRVEFATHLRASWPAQTNGSGAQSFADAAVTSLGGPDWVDGMDGNGGPRALTGASREVVEFRDWMSAFEARLAAVR